MTRRKIRKNVASFIRDYRDYYLLTQQQLADQLKLSRGYISDLERATKDMSLETLYRLATITQTNPNRIMAGV